MMMDGYFYSLSRWTVHMSIPSSCHRGKISRRNCHAVKNKQTLQLIIVSERACFALIKLIGRIFGGFISLLAMAIDNKEMRNNIYFIEASQFFGHKRKLLEFAEQQQTKRKRSGQEEMRRRRKYIRPRGSTSGKCCYRKLN